MRLWKKASLIKICFDVNFSFTFRQVGMWAILIRWMKCSFTTISKRSAQSEIRFTLMNHWVPLSDALCAVSFLAISIEGIKMKTTIVTNTMDAFQNQTFTVVEFKLNVQPGRRISIFMMCLRQGLVVFITTKHHKFHIYTIIDFYHECSTVDGSFNTIHLLNSLLIGSIGENKKDKVTRFCSPEEWREKNARIKKTLRNVPF